MLLLSSLFFFYEFIQMSVFNSIGTAILTSFSIGVTGLASIAAAYTYTMILFLLPAGILLDIYSPKKIIITAFSLSVCGTLLFSFSTTPALAEYSRMISGIGGAFAFLSCIKIASGFFPGKKMSLVVGVLITIAFLGGAVAQTPFIILVQKFEWRLTLRFLALFGMLAITLIGVFLKDPVVTQKKNRSPFFKMALLSLRNVQTWLGGFYIMLMNLPIVLLGTLWGDFYLTQFHHFSAMQSSSITTMLFIGIMIGSPLFGSLSTRVEKRKMPLTVGCFLTLVSSLLLFTHYASTFAYSIIFFLLGFFSSAQGVGYPTIVENNRLDSAATASGIASIIIMGGSAFFKIFYGWLLNKNWNGKMLHHIPTYSSHAFTNAMLIFPVSFFICLCISFFIKETYCKIKPV